MSLVFHNDIYTDVFTRESDSACIAYIQNGVAVLKNKCTDGVCYGILVARNPLNYNSNVLPQDGNDWLLIYHNGISTDTIYLIWGLDLYLVLYIYDDERAYEA